MIDAGIQALIAAYPLGFTATVTPEGAPAVSPKGTYLVLDARRIAFAHIRSPGTLRNLAANPACEVNFIDVLRRTGARLRGTAQIVARGTETFAALHPRWHAVWPDLSHRIGAVVVIDVTHVSAYRTPPYDDGVTEEEMIATYKAKFAEMA